jgi:inner membrane protein
VDTITQGLLGAVIAEAGFRRELGGRAVAWGAFCAVAPDFDIAAGLAGEWESLVHHRGISHSWLAETAAAPLLGLFAWRVVGRRRGRWWQWALLSWWTLVTHPALDVCTAYGTQLFAPLTRHRYAIDAISIVDLAYTLPLLVATLWAWRGTDARRRRRVAIGALIVSTAYLGFGWVQSQRALARAEADLAARGFEPAETRALPTLGNVFVFRVAARDGDGRYRVAMLSLSAPRPLEWHAAADDDDPLVRVARRSERGRIFRWFTMGYAWSELRRGDRGFSVRMSDLRYGSRVEPLRAMWGAEARFDRDGRLLEVVRWQGRAEMDWERELATLGAYLTGAPLPSARRSEPAGSVR